ncbi:MAG TPA: protein kinase [Gemmataceae bacterium]|nr:protein kinase [Gemmataceae bacterium]
MMNERAIFLAALEKDTPAQRSAYVAEACGGDEALRRRVEALLASHEQAGGLLEKPVPERLAEDCTARLAPDQMRDESAAGDGDADLSFLAPSSEPGSLGRLDHYEVLEVVGRGGMGVVLRARDRKLQRVVAIKVLAAALAASGSARQRFVREARAAAAVRDDHVIAIHSVEDQGPVPYLVMEFIDGCNLDALLRRGGPLEVKEILRIAIQVASGLAAAHKQGLIHRDVKPANILLENGVQRVKLTDFGLARAADDASLTQSGLIAGTPAYMSPEQANGEPVDQRSDLFSLGSVLYEVCTGRPAFRAPNTAAVLRRVSDERPRPIREVNSDIPESVCQVIEHLHAKKPADRPASAKEVADLLSHLLADLNSGRSGKPSGSSVLQSPARPPRLARRPWLWAAAALVLLCAGLALGEASGVTDVRGTVIRLFSPEGTLVLEVDDPGISVAVDGSDVVITGAGAKEIRLKPGQYKVEASKDGKVVRQELVTVERNGRRVVRVSKEVEPTEAERWEKSVAGLPAEQQVKAVVRRLKELNPAFDGTVTPTVENGVVTKLTVHTDEVADISPMSALKGLQSLECSGQHRQGMLADLTPLRGLRLKDLACWNTQVADLGPLRGMPLTVLLCAQTRVSDLSALQGMPLTVLTLQHTNVTSLAPLKGMPLTFLDLGGARGVSDLGPLRDMPLEYLNVGEQPVSDLAPLTGLKSLRRLVMDFTAASDLTPLRGLGLTELSIRNIPAKDFSPLKELALKSLRLDYHSDREEFVRSFTGLERINDKPVAEFWKDVDGK